MKRALFGALGSAALIVGSGNNALAQTPGVTPPVYRDLENDPAGAAPFAVIGDMQQTLWVERRVLMRESNPAEREALVRGLEAAHPGFLLIVGDLTNKGSSEAQWQFFDRLTRGLRALDLPIIAAVGNHDYWGDLDQARWQLGARFRQLGQSTWYSRIYGRLGLVVLDANIGVLSIQQWEAEQEWYRQTLEQFDADTAISGVLVFTHQPPYTNSTVTTDDLDVQAAFVPGFRKSHKALAMISGHTHSYEHLVEHDRQYIVTGGGGGPRVPLFAGADRRHPDLFEAPAPRPFHFLWITPETWGVRVEVRGLDKGQTVVRTIDQFELRW